VDAALGIIDRAPEPALIAASGRQQRWPPTRPLPGRWYPDTSSGDARLDRRITRSGC